MTDPDPDGDDVDIDVNEEQQPLLQDSTDMENILPTRVEKGLASSLKKTDSFQASVSQHSDVQVGIENLSNSIPPHESYEGVHRWDPLATWTPGEEAAVVRKTDFYLLTWVCLMVRNAVFLGRISSVDKAACSSSACNSIAVTYRMP